jgi:hypothetical protein
MYREVEKRHSPGFAHYSAVGDSWARLIRRLPSACDVEAQGQGQRQGRCAHRVNKAEAEAQAKAEAKATAKRRRRGVSTGDGEAVPCPGVGAAAGRQLRNSEEPGGSSSGKAGGLSNWNCRATREAAPLAIVHSPDGGTSFLQLIRSTVTRSGHGSPRSGEHRQNSP